MVSWCSYYYCASLLNVVTTKVSNRFRSHYLCYSTSGIGLGWECDKRTFTIQSYYKTIYHQITVSSLSLPFLCEKYIYKDTTSIYEIFSLKVRIFHDNFNKTSLKWNSLKSLVTSNSCFFPDKIIFLTRLAYYFLN